MKEKLTFEQIKQRSLDILLDVSSFCENNNIRYYLACGTLLGAIRHNGFIPWDDDIDIMMPRPDYKRFLHEYKSEKYELLKPSDGYFFFTKVCDPKTEMIESWIDYKNNKAFGLGIDIFPLDGMVNDEVEYKKRVRISGFFETLLRLSKQPIFYRKNPIKAINRIIPRVVGSKNIIKIIERIDQKYDYEKSEYVIRFKTTTNGETLPVSKEAFEPIKKEFEGHLFIIPRGYDEWLSKFFGDYTKLPSEENRIPHERECYLK